MSRALSRTMPTRYELASCPVCASSHHQVIAGADEVRAEIEALWEHHTGDARPLLTSAQLVDRVAFSQDPPLQVVRCTDCGLLFRNPRERDVREIYETERTDDVAFEALLPAQRAAFANPVARLTDLNGSAGRVLEVGSYVGAFLEAAHAAGWQARGVDVNPRAVAFARAHGHDVRQGTIDDVPAEERFDAIAFWNCFDQLPDPLAAAHAAHDRLAANGLLALRVPNGEVYLALRARLDGPLAGAARSLLARHNLLGFPYRHGFTPASLRRLLERSNFEMIAEEDAVVLPVDESASAASGGERLLAAAERVLDPVIGPPWLEVYARRSPRVAARR
jgi:SAM-dependent methyltransferase